MAVYSIEKLRNIALLGHVGDGKTALTESMLYLTKATDRLGKASDGNTVCDFDPEEIKRQFSISTAIAPVEYNGHKINVLDCPGFFDFVGEVHEAIRVADAGCIVVTAKGGVNVGCEKSFRMLTKAGLPKFFYIGKMDEEHADFHKVAADLREKFGISVCPVVFPVMNGNKVDCVVDIISGKAYKTDGLKTTEVAIPDSAMDYVEEYKALISENAAEASEELMEKFFEGEEFTAEELLMGVSAGVKSGSICPVFGGCAYTGAGTTALMDGIINYAPNPAEGQNDMTAEGEEFKLDVNGAPALYVFKNVADQYGRLSYFRVVSGTVDGNMILVNNRSGAKEKLGHVYMIRGKKSIEVDSIGAGDIGAVSKLTDTTTCDTLSENGALELARVEFPRVCYSRAIFAKGGSEDKMSTGLARLRDEDPCMTTEINSDTHEQIISGMGDMHLEVICSKLKAKFGVEVTTEEPRIAYREKIRKKVQAQGRHKKQSGGSGQFGDVWIEFEPGEELDLEFGERIFGGSVPRQYFPSVEKGLRDSIKKGVLAGYPVVQLKATLYDGSYHPVDSKDIAFQMAARIAYKKAIPEANPVILEPYGTLKVYVPDEYMGDIIGDLNKRRGRVMGMNPAEEGMQVIEAEVPFSEMSTYAIDLRSMTRGWGTFELDFVRYEETPPTTQAAIIEEAKARMEEDDDE
ncbi:MAG: elongation factor G [Clostridia bacterium]|nr:elongation factor G [Clostridia bacterium]